MKKYITYFTVVISLGACIPPGKLSESLDANSKLSSRYDSLNNKLKDTLTTFSNSLSSLKGNINTLKDKKDFIERYNVYDKNLSLFFKEGLNKSGKQSEETSLLIDNINNWKLKNIY